MRGQHHSDIAADEAALGVLLPGGVGVLSEESGLHEADRDVVVVVDPLDGSTNAAHGIPWYAVSLCAVDAEGPRAALVINIATGERFEAVRGGGATRNGEPDPPVGCDAARHVTDRPLGLSAPALRLEAVPRARGVGARSVRGRVRTPRRVRRLQPQRPRPWDYLGRHARLPRSRCGDARRVRRRRSWSSSTTRRRTPIAAATQVLARRDHRRAAFIRVSPLIGSKP